MQDVRKAILMWEKVQVPVLGVVENMSYFEDETGKRHAIFGSGGGKVLAEKFKTRLLGEIPLVTRVREAGDSGTPVVLSDPKSPVAIKFLEAARNVARAVSQKNEAMNETMNETTKESSEQHAL